MSHTHDGVPKYARLTIPARSVIFLTTSPFVDIHIYTYIHNSNYVPCYILDEPDRQFLHVLYILTNRTAIYTIPPRPDSLPDSKVQGWWGGGGSPLQIHFSRFLLLPGQREHGSFCPSPLLPPYLFGGGELCNQTDYLFFVVTKPGRRKLLGFY